MRPPLHGDRPPLPEGETEAEATTLLPDPAPSAAEASAQVSIRAVVLATGEPITGARIMGQPAGGAVVALGDTDARGFLQVEVSQATIWTFSGRREPGWLAREVIWVPDGTASGSGAVTLGFEPARRLQGRVLWASGRPVNEPVVVYAWPDGEAPPAELIANRGDVHPPAASALTRPDGTFEIGGIPLIGPLSVVPAADGCFFSEHRNPVAAVGDAPVTLVIERLFGAIVELRASNGGELRAPIGSYGPSGAQLAPLGAGLRVRGGDFDGLALAIAGLDLPVLDLDGWRRRLVLAAGPELDHQVGPVSFSVEIPGHLPMEIDLDLQRLDLNLREIVLGLSPNHAGFGSLIVELSGGEWLLAETGLLTPTVVLRLTDAMGHEIGVPLRPSAPGDLLRVEDLPLGSYSARLVHVPDMSVLGEQLSVTLGTRGPSRIAFDASDRGSLVVDLQLASGRDLAGPAALVVAPSGRLAQAMHLAFAGPPFRVPGLIAGDYTVRVERPTLLAGDAWQGHAVVAAGTEVRLSIRPKP